MKKPLLFLYVLALITLVSAQPVPDKADSLRKEIAEADSSRYESLFMLLSSHTRLLSPESDVAESEKTIKVVEDLPSATALIYAYYNLGNAFVHAKRSSEALVAFQKAYDLGIEHNQKYETGLVALRMGTFYFSEQFLTEALEKYYQADQIFMALGNAEKLFNTSTSSSLINY